MESRNSSSPSRTTCFLLLLLLLTRATAANRRVSVPDDLSDVVDDDEEEEEWKTWGQKATRKDTLPPPDFSKMNPAEIQAEMMKRLTGPVFGFVKLRPDADRSKDDVPMIAMRWSKVIRTGSVEARFMAVDRSTVMFTMERGQDLEEFKDFVLSQSEAYEIKIGEKLFQRPGDPSYEEVIERMTRDRSRGDTLHPSKKEQKQNYDEL